MNYLELIKELRQLVPISISEAKRLLINHEGDKDLVVTSWKCQEVDRLVSEANITKEQALVYLIQHNYDYQKAIKEAFSQTHDLLERILVSTRDLWSRLYIIAGVIEKKNKIEEYVFYSDSALVGLPEGEAKFYMIWQWINYIQLESTAVIGHTPKEVVAVLKELSLDWHVQMIEKVQKGEAQAEEVAGEFIVESAIGQALLRLISSKKLNKPY